MTKSTEQLYNLVFAGELLPDTNVKKAKQTLADFFSVSDPSAMDPFFSGRRTALRRNISQGEALRIYRQLRSLGLMSEVVKVHAPEPKTAETPMPGIGDKPVTSEPKRPQKPISVSRPSPTATPAPKSRAPEPTTKALAEPVPAPKTKIKAAAKTKTAPKAKAKAAAKTKPAPKAKTKAAAKTKPAPKAKTKAAAKTKPAPKAKAKATARTKTAPKAKVKAAAKAKPAPKAEVTAAAKAMPAAKVQGKATVKAETKTTLATDPKASPKPEDEAKPRADTKAPTVTAKPGMTLTPLAAAIPKAEASLRAKAAQAPGAAPEATAKAKPKAAPPPPADAKPAAETTAPTRKATPAPNAATERAPRKVIKPSLKSDSVRENHLAGTSTQSRTKQTPSADRASKIGSGTTPNLFALRPAHAEQSITQVRETAQIRALIAASAALALLILALVVTLRLPALPEGAEPLGPIALTSLSDNTLILMTEQSLLMHERSGLPRERIAASALGLETLTAPVWAASDNSLLLNARGEDGELRLLRCDLLNKQCLPFFQEPFDEKILAITGSLVGGTIFLMTDSGRTVRSSIDGTIEEEAQLPRPAGVPRLLARQGLLFSPADEALMLGVFSPDRRRYGQQLDALLLLADTGTPGEYARIRDVAMHSTANWALLQNNESTVSLYRFDPRWGSSQQIALPRLLPAPYLFSWRDKLLLADPSMPELLRFSSTGTRETSLISELLTAEREDWLEKTQQRRQIRALGIALPLLLAACCTLFAILYWSAQGILPQLTSGPTDLLDPMPGGVSWLPAGKDRQLQLGRLTLIMLVLPALGLLAAVLYGRGGSALLAFVPAFAGAAYASMALRRGCAGHLGLLEQKTIAVDHDNRYYFGPHNALLGGAQLLVAPSLALPVALPGLRNIDASAHKSRLEIDASNKSLGPLGVLAMLWQFGHPWGYAMLSLLVSWMLTLTVWTILN
ncbi:MAG: hypothetical protein AB8B57_13225 [Congregibacter sp.]